MTLSNAARKGRILLVGLAALSLAACGFNSVPTKQEAAKAKWADVEANFQRRANLVPNLAAVAKGAAEQEKEILTGVTEARAKATSIQITGDDLGDPAKMEQFSQAQSQLSAGLGRLMASFEAIPTSRRTRITACCKASWKVLKTASRSRSATTMRPSRTTTPRCAPSPR